MLSEGQFIEACKQVEDPELNIDIWTLGLIYDKKIEENNVWIKMTFTSPFCPFGPELVKSLKEKMKEAGVANVEIEITFNPPWQPTDELKEILSMH